MTKDEITNIAILHIRPSIFALLLRDNEQNTGSKIAHIASMQLWSRSPLPGALIQRLNNVIGKRCYMVLFISDENAP